MLEAVADVRQRLTDLVMSLPVEARTPFVEIGPEVTVIWNKLEEQQANESSLETLRVSRNQLLAQLRELARNLAEKQKEVDYHIGRGVALNQIIATQKGMITKLKKTQRSQPKPPESPPRWFDKVRRDSAELLD